jgi:hypothetical protein
MTEMVMSGSMSGEGKRSDGLLGESGHERRHLHQAPPVLYATAPFLDSTISSTVSRVKSGSRAAELLDSEPEGGAFETLPVFHF